MKGKSLTKAEEAWTEKVCSIGCIVCLNHGIETPLVTPHHMIGHANPHSQYFVLPLCGAHHQFSCPNGSWATRHSPGRNAGKVAFERAYGTEEQLLAQVREMCGWESFKFEHGLEGVPDAA